MKDKPICLRFIEFMPFNSNDWNKDKLVDFKTTFNEIGKEFELEKIEDEKNFVARKYKIKGHQAEIGFISSMTN